MFLELLEGPFWKTWNVAPPPEKQVPIPTFPTEIHATDEERVVMCAPGRSYGRDCEKSLTDARSVKDILDAPQPKDAEGRAITDVCMLGLAVRPPDDALEIVDKLPIERWCRYCQKIQGALFLKIGERSAPAFARFLAKTDLGGLRLFRYTSTPLIFPALLEAAVSDERRDEARRHMRRFPRGTASIALAIAAGADPAAAGVPPYSQEEVWGDPEPCSAIRAGMMLSIFARIGCEDHVMAAARELGLEDVAKRWIARPVVARSYDAAGSRMTLPKTVTFEGKRLDEAKQKNLLGLLARIDWTLAARDVQPLRDALDAKTRAKIADALAKRWKRRTRDAWVPIAAIVLAPERAQELANPAAIAHPSDSHQQRAVERVAVEAIARTAVLVPEERDAMLASLGRLALDPVKVRRHMEQEANAALVQVAEALGLPTETLDDRTIPSLGLDANGALVLDWGGRPIEVRMTSALELVFVVDGEKRPSQPTPRKGDNKKKVAIAKKHVERLRKDARVLAHGLAPRVTCWMRDRQRWDMADFRTNVLGHPVLRAIAHGFVWATYDDAPFGGACTASFRVAEDGSFADVNEDGIDPKGRVGLLHPAECEPEVARRWGSIMADYELLPLVQQLADPRTFTAEQAASDEIGRDLVEPTWRGANAAMPYGWKHARTRESNGAWERIIGHHRLLVQLFFNVKRVTLRAMRADDWSSKWVKLGEINRIAAHEALVDFDEMVTAIEKAK